MYNDENNKYDDKKYKREYKKTHYKQFVAKLKPEEMDELNELLDKYNIEKPALIRYDLELLRQGKIHLEKDANETK